MTLTENQKRIIKNITLSKGISECVAALKEFEVLPYAITIYKMDARKIAEVICAHPSWRFDFNCVSANALYFGIEWNKETSNALIFDIRALDIYHNILFKYIENSLSPIEFINKIITRFGVTDKKIISEALGEKKLHAVISLDFHSTCSCENETEALMKILGLGEKNSPFENYNITMTEMSM